METVGIISRNVYRLRINNKLQMTELSRRSKVSKVHIWQIETGKAKNPSIKTIDALAKGLGVSSASLLMDDETMRPQHADYITNKFMSLCRTDRIRMYKIINVLSESGENYD